MPPCALCLHLQVTATSRIALRCDQGGIVFAGAVYMAIRLRGNHMRDLDRHIISPRKHLPPKPINRGPGTGPRTLTSWECGKFDVAHLRWYDVEHDDLLHPLTHIELEGGAARVFTNNNTYSLYLNQQANF